MRFTNRPSGRSILSLSARLLMIGSTIGITGCATYTSTYPPHSTSTPSSVPPAVRSPDFQPGQPQTTRSSQHESSSSGSNTTQHNGYDKPRATRHPTIASDRRNQAVENVYNQAMNAFHRQEWHQTIQLSERGLRMQRQFAPFYWLLAESYYAKGNLGQAQAFARQGLNYARRESDIQARLIRLSEAQ